MPDKNLKALPALSEREVSAFCGQLAMLLHDGMLLDEATELLAALPAKDEAALSAVYIAVRDSLRDGGTLSAAAKSCGAFPPYMLSVLEISERAGRLQASLSSLSAYYERSATTRARIGGAVTYPTALFCMMSVVLWVMVLAVFPMLSRVLGSLGANMGISDSLTAPLAVGRALGIAAAVILSVCALILALCLIIMQSRGGYDALGRLCGRLGLFSRIREDNQNGAFSYSLSLLMASGCDAAQALDIIEGAFCGDKNKATSKGAAVGDETKATSKGASVGDQNNAILALAAKCRTICDGGSSAAQALIEMKIFSGADAHMLLTAYKTGMFCETLSKLSDRKMAMAVQRTDEVLSRAEPISVAAVSAVMGIILLTIMLPAASIMNVIG